MAQSYLAWTFFPSLVRRMFSAVPVLLVLLLAHGLSWAQPLISCGDNSSLPCPLPQWEPTWDLARSTAMQAANISGFFDASFAARFGLVSFDAINAQSIWLARSTWNGTTSANAEELLVQQCQRVKAINPATKCMVYRKTALALQWMTTQRGVMNDAQALFFLQFQDTANSTAADKCQGAGPCTYAPVQGRPVYPNKGTLHGGPFCCPFSKVYCEMGGTTVLSHWQGQQQFFWNFSNPSLRKWWIANIFSGSTGIDNEVIDGCFSDDVTGLPMEHPDAVGRMGLSASQLAQLQTDTQKTWTRAIRNLVESGGYNWQMFQASDYATSPPSMESPQTCTEHMRKLCDPSHQHVPMLMGMAGYCCSMGDASCSGGVQPCVGGNATLAAFLIARPPHGFIGSGWIKYDQAGSPPVHTWNPLFDMDVGVPLETCQERARGVFSRRWSRGLAQLDCNTLKSQLNFSLKGLAGETVVV